MARAKTVTLTANAVQTVTVDSWEAVEVVNLSGAAEIWIRTDGIDPVVDADDCFVLPAAKSAIILKDRTPGVSATVKLLSSAAEKVHVRAIDHQGMS